MDLTRTRTALHGIAELLLAGPQYAASGTIRLRVVPGGIATVAAPDLRLEGAELVGAARPAPAARRATPRSRPRSGHAARRSTTSTATGPASAADDEIELDPEAPAPSCVDALAVGDAALRAFAPDEEPVLWPEHLDVAISSGEVNYGVSPGRRVTCPSPTPTSARGRRARASSGTSRSAPRRRCQRWVASSAVVGFFREGARLAGTDGSAT